MNRDNLNQIEELYARWKANPESIDQSWQYYFAGFEMADSGRTPKAVAQVPSTPPKPSSAVGADSARAGGDAQLQASVTRLVDAYREIGHMLAQTDPLKLIEAPPESEALSPEAFGLGDSDLETTFYSDLFDPPACMLRELIAALRETYCGSIGVEFMHIRNLKIREWLLQRMEPNRNRPQFDLRRRRRILLRLNAATLFENYLHINYKGQKRFSLEGGETLIPLLDAIIDRAAGHQVRDVVLGMPHRGRLNVLVNILNKPYSMVFHEFEGNMPPETVAGDGDVKYHLGFSGDYISADNRKVHLSLTANPSHLEAVNPVVEGRMRAKQRPYRDQRQLGLPILIHGDAAFSGQGIVSETLNLSQLPGYRTGGSIHVVVNNQIGFTTSPSDARSSRYCTDVAKMIDIPIFHVNADDPEAVVYVAELALDFRQEFGRDVVIDMVCFRRHGHNEGDEPRFTQPRMYQVIDHLKPIRDRYTESLIASGDLNQEEADTIAETFSDKMKAIHKEVKQGRHRPDPAPGFTGRWAELKAEYSFEPVPTGVDAETLGRIVKALTDVPDGFQLHRTIAKQVDDRSKIFRNGGPFNWAYAEALAFGSLMLEGHGIRISGQDSRRGTFSQRHAMWVDTQTGQPHYPLRHLGDDQANFCAYDSTLSEAAVLGFDYGYSMDSPTMLVMWEAQFGDFCNGAQVIIDQFIASGQSKWNRCSGLVLLLPHGYEGQGPEHSSARMERFLQLHAEDNIEVVNASSPAQYFHLLRRQVKRDFRRPLIVMTPKSLLRDKLAVSQLDELTKGHFQTVMDDDTVDPSRVRRVLLCSGKVYYDLLKHRNEQGIDHVALIRLEQVSPWPADALKAVLDRYDQAEDWVWVQEESQNSGAWSFVEPRLAELSDRRFRYVGRDASASPATGSKKIHDLEQTQLVTEAVGGVPTRAILVHIDSLAHVNGNGHSVAAASGGPSPAGEAGAAK